MKNDKKIFLRDTNFSDIKFLWRLRNQPNIYKYSKNNRPVVWKEHTEWFLSALDEISKKRAKLFIIQEAKTPIGQIRFNYKDRNKTEVSISVLRNFQGKGFSTKALKLAIKRLKKEKKTKSLIAVIHKKNIKSQKLFEKLKFKPKERKRDWLKYNLDL